MFDKEEMKRARAEMDAAEKVLSAARSRFKALLYERETAFNKLKNQLLLPLDAYQHNLEVGVHNFNNCFLSTDGKWYRAKRGSNLGDAQRYRHHAELVGDEPPMFDRFLKWKEEVEQTTGFTVVIREFKFEKPDRLRSSDDITAFYGEDSVEEIGEGKIWYEGWDIHDPWCHVRINGEDHVFLSTNGHGFGFDIIVNSSSTEDERREMLSYFANHGYVPSSIQEVFGG